MGNTNVENTFMEMIQPKVNEIKERFSQGKVLSQEDINTLLLQSQYNHINHLDQGLTSVEAQVKELKHEFILMEERVNTKFEQMNARFESRFEQVNTKFEQMNARFESRFEQVNTKFEQMNARFESRFEQVNTKFEEVNTKFEEVNTRIERLQTTLIKSIILVMGGLFTIFKVIDLLLV